MWEVIDRQDHKGEKMADKKTTKKKATTKGNKKDVEKEVTQAEVKVDLKKRSEVIVGNKSEKKLREEAFYTFCLHSFA